ncbi:MAG TPA: hypothetical protein VJH68_01925, partial [Candidatus Nanoarchaeia archaeon]|nr:hypothetical protein [Candidatus Nanoarchaeia archaeon]
KFRPKGRGFTPSEIFCINNDLYLSKNRAFWELPEALLLLVFKFQAFPVSLVTPLCCVRELLVSNGLHPCQH